MFSRVFSYVITLLCKLMNIKSENNERCPQGKLEHKFEKW